MSLAEMFTSLFSSPTDIAGQIVGLFGFLCTVLSYQSKKTKFYYLLQGTSGAFFTVSFFLLSNPTAALLNMLNIFRGVIFAAGEKCRKIWIMVCLVAANAVATAVSCIWRVRNPIEGKSTTVLLIIAVLVFFAQVLTTYLMWTQDGRKIRVGQLVYVSPAWLFNNIYCFSVPGILCESFTIISVIVSFVRFGWNGLARGAEGTGTEGK